MEIKRLVLLTDRQINDVIILMKELNPDIQVNADMLLASLELQGSYFFALLEGEHIVGCASLCVYESPTGRKACIEDVVVLSSYRGRHLGKQLLEHLISHARKELSPIVIHLTSNPTRFIANNMYKSLGFKKRETNVYKMELTKGRRDL